MCTSFRFQRVCGGLAHGVLMVNTIGAEP